MSTGKLRFLTLVKPVLHVLPEVAQPDRKIPFKARFAARPAGHAARARVWPALLGSACPRAASGRAGGADAALGAGPCV